MPKEVIIRRDMALRTPLHVAISNIALFFEQEGLRNQAYKILECVYIAKDNSLQEDYTKMLFQKDIMNSYPLLFLAKMPNEFFF